MPGMGYQLNNVQQFLWDHWKSMVNSIGHVDCVICDGDMVEGINRREGAKQTIPDVLFQAKMAKELLMMIDTDKFIFTCGSPYHVGANPNADQMVCDLTGGEYLEEDGNIIIDNIIIHVRHDQPYAKDPSGRYNSQQKDAMIMRLNNDNADIFLRGHTHRFNYSGNIHNLSVSIPCWKSLDAFMRRTSQELPDCGYILFNIEGSDYSWNQMVFNVPNKLFRKTIKI
jgi:hypothetical protein